MSELQIPVGDGGVDAYLAVPAVAGGPWPAVVVVHDAFGLTDVTREHADHLAAAGYLAVVPDLYTRGGMARCVRETFRSLSAGRGRPFDDIEAVRHWALARDDTTDRVGVIGFCMGGGFALATAATGFAASAPNYGMLPKDRSMLDGACPVVASYGAQDRGLRGTAAELEALLAERGIPHDVKEYPDAGHSFMERFNTGPFTPLVRVAGLGYHHPSAEDAWGRILRFFAEHLQAG
ncbi:MAG TPA: dienelactone hydrolase family protein [Acidimicrobiales bacterium]|nr:dienelactone hydrolase family protein [Acidimicrobiales bacterium]